MCFEKNHQGYCGHRDHLIILGTGGMDKVGSKGKFYNGYYCPKCKRVYYEDCHFGKPYRLFYSKKATIDELKFRRSKQKVV